MDSEDPNPSPELPDNLAELISSAKLGQKPGDDPDAEKDEIPNEEGGDSGNARWKQIATIGGAGSGVELRHPFSASISEERALFVMDFPDRETYRISEFDLSGRFVRMVLSCAKGSGPADLLYPKGLAVGKGLICIPDAGNDRIQMFTESGEHRGSLGEPGEEEGQFDFPCDVDIDELGVFYIADTGNNRVQKVTSQGDHLATFGAEDIDSDEALDEPSGVTFDEHDCVYVADSGNNRVVKFSPDGKMILAFGKSGDAQGDFEEPSDIRVESNGTILVADNDNTRVQIFTAEGGFIESFQLASPGAGESGGDFAIDDDGFLYVCDAASHTIAKIEIFRTQNL